MTKCEVIFDVPKGIYHPGQTIHLTFNLKLSAIRDIKSIFVTILGCAHCKFRVQRNDYEGNENYLMSTTYLVGNAPPSSSDDHRETIKMSKGLYTYNVECTLPEGLPSSFEFDHDNGYIRYLVNFVIETGPYHLNMEFKKEFTVIRPVYDLNLEPHLLHPVEMEKHRPFSGCCLQATNPVMIRVRIPRSGYVVGEKIPIDIELDNKSGSDIRKFEFIFQRKIVYFAPGRKPKKITLSDNLLTMPCTGFVPGIGRKLFRNFMEVPEVQPNSIKIAKVFSYYYALEVKVIPENECYDIITIGDFPLTIGTEPFHQFPIL